MDESSAQNFLHRLWADVGLNAPKCCHCSSPIELGSHVLARTFCLKSQCITNGKPHDNAEVIEVPELDDQILVFNRHLNCLLRSTKYVAISHVWHRDVADVQYQREKSKIRRTGVAQHVREVPARVCRGAVASLGECVEIWHDYISVPQWQDEAKRTILQAMQQIFGRAMLTVVYLSDLEAATLHTMRNGDSQKDRCRAISRICNARWFSRVWTAMEFTQSPKLCFMTKDFMLSTDNIRQELDGESLVAELSRRWTAEFGERGTVHEIEHMVGIGYNLVPWQLGPLDPVRQQRIEGIRNSFAMAIDLLSRRCVTMPRDFFHALMAILRTGLFVHELPESPSKALLEVARSCLKDGDLSPLFMVPAAVQRVPDELVLREHGYHDINTFALGRQIHSPTYSETKFNPANNNPVVLAERIGTVYRVVRLNLPHGEMESFQYVVELTLEVTGVEVDDFIQTLGGRLFGVVDTRKIFQRLSEDGRRGVLETKLGLLRDIWIDADWAFRLELDPHPSLVIHKQSKDTARQHVIDLVEALGNDNGKFSEADKNFHLSARDIQLKGTILIAKLRTIDGEWRDAEFDVTKLSPQPGEHIEWICNAMGLYDRDLGWGGVSPMKWLRTHGSSIHLGWHQAILSVSCLSCHRTYLIRAAVYAKDYLLGNSTVWTIPGLRYECTFQGGAGFLLNKSRLVGRVLWATPTCDCPKLEEVEVLLDELPLPHPNTLEYGKGQEQGEKWVTMFQRMRAIG